MKRHKTKYPGVFYREAERIGGKGPERVYYIVFKKAGKVHEEKAGRQYADDMTPARASRIRAERIEGKRLSRKEIREAAKAIRWTVDKLWEEYISHKPDTKGFKTDRYRYEKFLKAEFGRKAPSEITQMDIYRLRLSLGKRLKPQTEKHVLMLLQRVINFGTNKGLCEGLSFKIEVPEVHNLKTEDLTPEQLTRLMEAIDQESDLQAANFLRLALYTGMRRGELFKLQWQDVDFFRGFIYLKDPKGKRDQAIPLNELAREVLLKHPRSNSLQIFPGRYGGQRTRIPKRIDAIREKAGLLRDFRPLHGLRHVYASMLASSGQVDLYTLQKLLTHKSAAMTQRYAHLRDEALRKASELAGDLIDYTVTRQRQEGFQTR
jgi:integrase